MSMSYNLFPCLEQKKQREKMLQEGFIFKKTTTTLFCPFQLQRRESWGECDRRGGGGPYGYGSLGRKETMRGRGGLNQVDNARPLVRSPSQQELASTLERRKNFVGGSGGGGGYESPR